MSQGFLRFLVLGSVLALLAGCGGSSNTNGSSGGSGGGSGGGGNPTTVTITFKGPAPAAVAARIGTGAFVAQTLSSSVLSLSIPSGTSNFAVAFVCPPLPVTSGGAQIGQTVEESVIEASTADGTAFTQTCPTSSPTGTTGILTGSVDASAIAGVSFLNIDAQSGDLSASVYSGSSTANFSFSAPAGNDRVDVLAYNSVLQGTAETFSLVGIRNFSSQTVPGILNAGNTVVLSSADQIILEPITYGNVPSGFSAPSTLALYQTAGGGGFVLANAATSQYPAVPTGAIQTGDLYGFLATARNNSQAVAAYLYASAGGSVSFTFPAPWSYGGPTPAALPTFDFTYSGFSGKSGVSQGAAIAWSTGTSSESVLSIAATTNYQGASTSLTIPDLSGISGFLAAPKSGTAVAWSALIAQSSGSALQTSSSNAASMVVQNSGAYTLP